jgi:hypothetical protein
MSVDTTMDRIRAANPVRVAETASDPLLAQILATPGDPRLATPRRVPLEELQATDHRSTSRRRVGRKYLAVALLIGAAAVLALPAFGVVDRILDAFTGTPPTPLVEENFTNTPNSQFFGQLEPRGVLAWDAGTITLHLWATPAANGRRCWLIQMGESQNGSRYGPSSCFPTASSDASGMTWFASRNSFLDWGRYIVGYVDADAATVAISLDDGTVVIAPVVENLFLATTAEATHVTKIEALDDGGTVIAESTHCRSCAP